VVNKQKRQRPKTKSQKARNPQAPARNPKRRKRRRRRRKMMTIHMPSQSSSHAAAAIASAPMNLLRNLHAADASQLNAVLLPSVSLPSSLPPFSSFGTSSYS